MSTITQPPISSAPKVEPSPSQMLDWYRQMSLIRQFEVKCAQSYQQQKIGGFCHLYVGQEAVAVGTIAATRPQDYIITAYRDHGHAIARGMEMAPLTEILFGNPRAGTPLMQADPLAAFDLPLKAIVMQRDDGPVEVLMLTAQTFAARYGGAEVAEKVFGNSAGLIAAAVATLDR